MKRLLVLASVIGAAALSGCYLPPEGDAPLRYRDDLPGKTVQVTSNVVYSSEQDGTANELLLDVYRPTPDDVTKRPLVIFIHGGGFWTGTKNAANMVTLARAYAQKGFVTASIDYRLLGPDSGNCGHSPDTAEQCVIAAFAAQHDAQAAVRYLRANAATFGIDPARIAVSGGSAGAETALLVAIDDEDVGSSGTPGVSSAVGAAFPISGATPPQFRGIFRYRLDRTDAPVYFFYGDSDQVVPPAWVEQNAADLNELGGGADLYKLKGGHVPFTEYDQNIYETQGVYFLYEKLDLANAEG
jgi:acetyl esterase/lipase